MFRNHYDCPCGNHWEDEHECTVDDDCAVCGTTCSPTESQDVEDDTPPPCSATEGHVWPVNSDGTERAHCLHCGLEKDQ